MEKAVRTCDDMRPDISPNPEVADLGNIRNLLSGFSQNVNNSSSRLTRVSNRNDRKQLEESLQDISSDLMNVQNKFSVIVKSISHILDKVEDLEKRIVTLENTPPQPSYASVLDSNPPNDPSPLSRIDKLEFVTSEEERKNRLLNLTITHADIDVSHPDLDVHTNQFLQQKLNMSPREIDANVYVQKTRRPNTVMLKLSDKKFKSFIYSARKTLRNSSSNLTGLYINEYLTSYNYTLLKKLKTEKKRRNENNLPNFNSVYSFEGRVFVKLHGSEQSGEAIHMKNSNILMEFLGKLDSVPC